MKFLRVILLIGILICLITRQWESLLGWVVFVGLVAFVCGIISDGASDLVSLFQRKDSALHVHYHDGGKGDPRAPEDYPSILELRKRRSGRWS